MKNETKSIRINSRTTSLMFNICQWQLVGEKSRLASYPRFKAQYGRPYYTGLHTIYHRQRCKDFLQMLPASRTDMTGYPKLTVLLVAYL